MTSNKSKVAFIPFMTCDNIWRWIWLNKNIKMSNDLSHHFELGIDSYHLHLHHGHTLLLHNILFIRNIQRNLLSIVALLRLGFKFTFDNNYIKLFLGTIYYGCGFLVDNLMVLDIYYSNNYFNLFFMTSIIDYVKWHTRLGHILKKFLCANT